jgi:palmitoyltransferase
VWLNLIIIASGTFKNNFRIRQCVGQRNYKYFISFLFLHSMWCSYLAIIGSLSLYSTLEKIKFWDSTFRMGNQIVRGDNLLALQYVFVM